MTGLLLDEIRRRVERWEVLKLLLTLVFLVGRSVYGPLCTVCAVAAGNALYHQEADDFLRWLVLAVVVDTGGPPVIGLVGAMLPPPPPPPPPAPPE